MVIVIGTGLAVEPFNKAALAGVSAARGSEVPRVLINLENTKASGFDFDDAEKFPERLFLQSKCDDTVLNLCRELDWEEDL